MKVVEVAISSRESRLGVRKPEMNFQRTAVGVV